MRARRLLLGLLLPSFAASWAHSLWPDGAPDAADSGPKHSPRITVVDRTEKGAQPRAAVVILPGGGYAQLSTSPAVEAARWLNEHGVVGYVVEYRLGTNGYLWPVPARDAARAALGAPPRGENPRDPEREGRRVGFTCTSSVFVEINIIL